MDSREYSFLDRCIGEIDKAIKTLSAPSHPLRACPAAAPGPGDLAVSERRESIRLMRVNHAGEIAAQGLYQGQSLTARDPAVAAAMRRAAAEETDHLGWCEQRLRELDGRSSLLNPLWYVGSFTIGALAGALGDRASLGFVAETERQVEAHLQGHLGRLPATDRRSRAILEQMRHDETLHGATATAMGGESLPEALRAAMRLSARVMTGGSYWI
jgi:ubiquinone biosynthesis monooxygenase Coq7